LRIIVHKKITIPGMRKLEVPKSDKYDCLNAIKIRKFTSVKIYGAGLEGPAHDLLVDQSGNHAIRPRQGS
jgi:hypothetical protein